MKFLNKIRLSKIGLFLTLLFAALSILTAFSIASPTLVKVTEGGNSTFEKFLSEFPKGKLPFALTAETLQKHMLAKSSTDNTKKSPLQTKRLAYEYNPFLPHLEDGYSRLPPSAEGLMAVNVENNKHLVVYVTGRARYGFQTFYAVIYDEKGTILKDVKIAKTSEKELLAGAIDENLNITLTNYTINWYKDEEGYETKIKSLKKTKEEVKQLLEHSKSSQKNSKEVKKAAP